MLRVAGVEAGRRVALNKNFGFLLTFVRMLAFRQQCPGGLCPGVCTDRMENTISDKKPSFPERRGASQVMSWAEDVTKCQVMSCCLPSWSCACPFPGAGWLLHSGPKVSWSPCHAGQGQCVSKDAYKKSLSQTPPVWVAEMQLPSWRALKNHCACPSGAPGSSRLG